MSYHCHPPLRRPFSPQSSPTHRPPMVERNRPSIVSLNIVEAPNPIVPRNAPLKSEADMLFNVHGSSAVIFMVATSLLLMATSLLLMAVAYAVICWRMATSLASLTPETNWLLRASRSSFNALISSAGFIFSFGSMCTKG